jgi:ankyrin repeat protein/uncharacterized protein YecT (DUF1311 family)
MGQIIDRTGNAGPGLMRGQPRRRLPWAALWAGIGAVLFNAWAVAQTPAEHLMALVESQDLDKIAAYLAQPGVNINDRPDEIKTLLDFAAERNEVSVVTYLLDHGADINTKGRSGEDRITNRPATITPLARAANFNALDVMRLLIQRGAEVNTPIQGFSPLFLAAARGNRDAVDLLVEHGADVNHKFAYSQTPMNAAIEGGYVEIALYLHAKGATFLPGDVIKAARTDSLALVNLTLGPDSSPPQDLLNAALAAAAANTKVAEATRQQMLTQLMAHGANPATPQNGLSTGVLPEAASAETATFLLDHGANALANRDGYELAADIGCHWFAVQRDPLPLYRMLVARGLDFKPPLQRANNPVGCAATAGNLDAIDYLIANGADVAHPDLSGRAPIFEAKTKAVVDDLVKHGASLEQTLQGWQPDGSLRPHPGVTPLQEAMSASEWDRVLFLISMGADVQAQGDTLLSEAAIGGQLRVLDALLARGPNIKARSTIAQLDTALLALLAVVRSGSTPMIVALLDRGAEVNTVDAMGRTPLFKAVEARDMASVRVLLARGADPDLADRSGITPLIASRTDELRGLLSGRAPPSVTDGTSAQDVRDCAEALVHLTVTTPVAEVATASKPREPGEDWEYFDSDTGAATDVTVNGRPYLLARSTNTGYLARIDSDGVERVVCEYGSKGPAGELRRLSEYERLQARALRDDTSVSQESLKLQGLRGAMALLQMSRRPQAPVPLSVMSEDTVLADAIRGHRDDLLAYYLDQGIDANLVRRNLPAADSNLSSEPSQPALFLAVTQGSEAAVDLLLVHGANPDAREPPPPGYPEGEGTPAIAAAVMKRDPTVVADLLAHGASPDIPTGPVPASGDGIYRVFHNVLGGELNQWAADRLFKNPRSGPNVLANAEVMFRHGAAVDPWLNGMLSNLGIWAQGAHLSLPESFKKGAGIIPDSQQVRETAAAIQSTAPEVADLMMLGLRYRDAPLCNEATASTELQYCLPNSLRSANAELNTRYEKLLATHGTNVPGARQEQRAWLARRNESCHLHEPGGITQAGWLAYVLSDPARAQCVLAQTRTRVAQLSGN